MPGTIRRDSMSRCDDGNSIYSTIRNHHTPRQLPVRSADKFIIEKKEPTPETVQARLNREMLGKVENMSMRLPHDSFVAAVQVGKYMVLAIMLPPYLLMYGIPKWFFTVAIPNIGDFAKAHFTKVGNMVQQMSNKVVDLMKGALDQTLGEAMRMLRQQGQKFWNYASEMMKWPGNALAKAGEQTQKLLSGPYNSVKNSANELADLFAQQMQRISDLADGVTGALRRLANGAAGLTGGAKPYAKSGESFANTVSSNASALAMWMAAQAKRGMELGSNLLANLSDRGNALLDKIKGAADLVDLGPLKDRFDDLKDKVKEKVNDLSDRFNEIYTKVAEKSEQVAQQVAQVVMKNIMAIPQATFQMIVWTYRKLPEKRQSQLAHFYQQSRRFLGYMSSVYGGTKRGVKALAGYFIEAHSIIKAEIIKWGAWVVAKLKQVVEFVLSLPGKAYEFLKAIYPKVKYAAQQVTYALQLLAALVWAVTVLAFSSLSNMLARYSLGLIRK